MQAVSLDPGSFGLSLSPALVGTADWWRAIDDGLLPSSIVSGVISGLYWTGMGDWPECDVSDGQEVSRWAREGDVSRYVEGLQVKFTSVLHPWKSVDLLRAGVADPFKLLGAGSKIVLAVEIEESQRRSDPRAPGPGGVGLR